MSKCVEFQREIEASEARESKKLLREHIFGAPCAVPSMTKDTPRPRNVRTPGLKRGFYSCLLYTSDAADDNRLV